MNKPLAFHVGIGGSTEKRKRGGDTFLDRPQKMVGKTIAKVQTGIDDNFLMLFTDGTWATTPINSGDCDYWIQDAVTLGVLTQEEADAETAELEAE
jgi:hypothetical protein